jgi:hypothetical protein
MYVTNMSSHAVWMFTSSFSKTSFKVHPSYTSLGYGNDSYKYMRYF